jgi:hypothetical protein
VTTRHAIAALGRAVLLLATACDAGLGGVPPAAPLAELRIPGPRPAKRAKTVEEALRVYPTLEAEPRDPFLTAAEQDALLHGTPVVEAIAVAPPPVLKKAVAKPKAVPVLEKLELELSTIFVSKDGRRNAVARDRRTGRDVQIAEGEEFGDFVVVSVSEEAVRLKERNGPATRTFPFKRSSADDIWLKKKP